ncbi:MAG: GWxTD domain-containing protein [Bacteroidetes bacterium]|nr:GWxTD domain-containing protein [Bacteroidota bacterium]
MKNSNLFFSLLILLSAATLRAQSGMDANISYATFKSDDGGYIEVYLHVVGTSVEFMPVTDSTKRAVVDVVVLFKQGEQIVKFDKYRLSSPPSAAPADFVDVKRYALANGSYQIEVSVDDTYRIGNSKRYDSAFSVNYDQQTLAQSDIQLVASMKLAPPGSENNPMAKGGYLFEPLSSNFYDKYDELLLFYHEIYNADKAVGADYLLSFFIDNADTKDKAEAISMSHKRKQAEPVTASMQQIDIRQLPSGNYHLVVELSNRDRQLLSQKSITFQRSNPYLHVSQEEIASGNMSLAEEFVGKLSEQDLVYGLKAIIMQVDKSDGEHVKTITSERNVNAMRLYLFSYWAKQSPTNPEAAYEAYMKVARQIDENFNNGFGYGFETDRGYVFLKYGAPSNTVFEENEPSAPPYEIWFYNQFPMTGQNNVKFLFYNPSLVTNGHVLLHSTARGEVNNPRWEVDLYRDAPMEVENNDYIDGTRMQSNTGRQARRLFESY